jgi:mannose-6-phosphate isomerase-like protein (cupin superfamily)
MAAAQVVLPCDDLEDTVDWFTAKCGFRLLMISPADDPSIALLEGHGLQVRLDRSESARDTKLRILVEDPNPKTLLGPNGTTIEFVHESPEVQLPANDPVFVHERMSDGTWGTGRAGMEYRDLIPDRQGGRFIASHIRILEGGPVDDYVHHHHIRFQMIFCHRGWAQLVYEDQGAPFRLEAGDCVLQPPHIRHQVLETSDEFEVVEIGSPAIHDTFRDHDMDLPTHVTDPARLYDGQHFVRHIGDKSTWSDWRFEGFVSATFDIETATEGLGDVCLVRTAEKTTQHSFTPDDEFLFWFIRSGTITLQRNDVLHVVRERDGLVLVAGEQYSLSDISPDLEILEVRIP